MKKPSKWIGGAILALAAAGVVVAVLVIQQRGSDGTSELSCAGSAAKRDPGTSDQVDSRDRESSDDENIPLRRIIHLPPSKYYRGQIVRRKLSGYRYDPFKNVAEDERLWDAQVVLGPDEFLCYLPDYAAKDNDFIYLRNAVPDLAAVDLYEARRITSRAFDYLADWPNLRYLCVRLTFPFRESVLKRDDLVGIGKLRMLTHLDMGGFGWVDGNVFSAIAEIATLEYLRVGVQENRGCQAALRRLDNLRVLILESLREPGEWLEAVSALHNLEEMGLDFVESPSDEDIGRIRTMTSLSYLALTGVEKLGDKAMEAFVNLTSLAELSIQSTGREFSGGGFQYLRSSRLRKIDVWNGKGITDEVFEALSGCQSLKEMDLYGCPKLSGAGIDRFVMSSGLSSLALRYCEGIQESALRGLARVDRPLTLKLEGCPQITRQSIEDLRKANRNLSIKVVR